MPAAHFPAFHDEMASRPINDLVSQYVLAPYAYLPIGMLYPFACIRPINPAGKENLKGLITTFGYNQQSMIKVKAPHADKRTHQSWTLADKQTQLKDPNYVPAGMDITLMKFEGKRTKADLLSLYGVIDGAHRYYIIMDLAQTLSEAGYSLAFLVPTMIMNNDIPTSLVIAIASRT